jgi:hypothetical protein
LAKAVLNSLYSVGLNRRQLNAKVNSIFAFVDDIARNSKNHLPSVLTDGCLHKPLPALAKIATQNISLNFLQKIIKHQLNR